MFNYDKAIEWELGISEMFFLDNKDIFFTGEKHSNYNFGEDTGNSFVVDTESLLQKYPFFKSEKKILKLIDRLTKKELIASIWIQGELIIAPAIKSKEWSSN